uniref:Uncharacterized protein n=1 Tax=Rhizophora mucronata TaxID=61149 RepID=A0A2P2Q8Y9_RHIMU
MSNLKKNKCYKSQIRKTLRVSDSYSFLIL